MKEEKPLSIRDNVSSHILKINYGDVLQYYYNIIKYLEINDKKRFQLLPQLSLKLSYVKFDSRMISTIYEKYNSDGIIKNFEKHYEEYYKKYFNFNKYKYNRNANPISFSTNGYSICINFELPNDIPIKRCKEKYSQKYKLKNINNIENIKKNLDNIAINNSYFKYLINDDNIDKHNDNSNSENDENNDNDDKKSKQKINFNNINKNKKFKRGLFNSDEYFCNMKTVISNLIFLYRNKC